MKYKILINYIFVIFLFSFCTNKEKKFDPDVNLNYCCKQIAKSLNEIEDSTMMPRNILYGEKNGIFVLWIFQSGQ